MKRLARTVGVVVVANVAANLALDAFRASGGTFVGMAFVLVPYAYPAPLRLMKM